MTAFLIFYALCGAWSALLVWLARDSVEEAPRKDGPGMQQAILFVCIVLWPFWIYTLIRTGIKRAQQRGRIYDLPDSHVVWISIRVAVLIVFPIAFWGAVAWAIA